jgi:hypothetical protein
MNPDAEQAVKKNGGKVALTAVATAALLFPAGAHTLPVPTRS